MQTTACRLDKQDYRQEPQDWNAGRISGTAMQIGQAGLQRTQDGNDASQPGGPRGAGGFNLRAGYINQLWRLIRAE